MRRSKTGHLTIFLQPFPNRYSKIFESSIIFFENYCNLSFFLEKFVLSEILTNLKVSEVKIKLSITFMSVSKKNTKNHLRK